MPVTKTRLGKSVSALNGFLYSTYYPLSIAIWAFLCFILNLQTLGLFVLIAVACAILVLIDDLTPLIPLLICFILAVRSFSVLMTVPYLIAYGLLFLCFVCHFIRFPFKNFYLGKLFFPMCLVSAALFLGGILSPNYTANYIKTLLFALSFGPLVLILYLLFLNGINPPKDFDFKTFLVYNIILATLVGCFEVWFIRYEQGEFFFKVARSVFWGNFNTVGAMTLISIPACFYLMVKTGKSLFLFPLIIFMLVTDIVSRSDGSSGIAILALPFLIILTFVKLRKKDRMQFLLCVCFIVFCLCIFGIVAARKFDIDEFLSLIEEITRENGRSILYENAIKLFKNNPVVGVGVGFTDETIYVPQDGAFNFHSTVLHIAATMGTLGLIAYAVYYYFRFRILLKNNSAFNSFMFFSFVLFEAYGLIDVCEFNIVPLMTYITLLFICTEKENYKGEDNGLPLSNN